MFCNIALVGALPTNTTVNTTVNTTINDTINQTVIQKVDAEGKVDVYVLDSGVDVTHEEFSEMSVTWKNFLDTSNIDCTGHGTHVASLITGKTHGVIKNANLISVKAIGCNGKGPIKSIVNAISWITEQHVNKRNATSIINMSFGMRQNNELDAVVNKAIDSGIHVVAAAGNDHINACQVSPARVPRVITVGAADQNLNSASFSNHGGCIDVYAPGVNIVGAASSTIGTPKLVIRRSGEVRQRNTKTITLNGTSMATPIVSGILIRHLITSKTQNGLQEFWNNINQNTVMRQVPIGTTTKFIAA